MRDRLPIRSHARPSFTACIVAAGLLLVASGCRNDCQQLCQEMADFAEEDCGKEFPKEEVNACMDAYHKRELEEGDEEVCADITPTLREEWTCDDINAYFTEATSGSGSSDTGA